MEEMLSVHREGQVVCEGLVYRAEVLPENSFLFHILKSCIF